MESIPGRRWQVKHTQSHLTGLKKRAKEQSVTHCKKEHPWKTLSEALAREALGGQRIQNITSMSHGQTRAVAHPNGNERGTFIFA